MRSMIRIVQALTKTLGKIRRVHAYAVSHPALINYFRNWTASFWRSQDRMPNNSFKPTPYRGLGLCAYATLAHRLATLGAA